MKEETAVNTYRNLPSRARKKLSLGDTFHLLALKGRYYRSLPYMQKCRATADQLAAVLHRQFGKSGIGKATIRAVLMAEEQYYRRSVNRFY